MTSHTDYLFLLGSARQEGNTAQLARHAAASLPAGARQQWLYLPDYPLPPFLDIRHHATETARQVLRLQHTGPP